MKVKFLGHNTIEIISEDYRLIIDPFITGNPLAKGVEVNNINADYIFVTHAHQDHILDVQTIAENNTATVVSNFEIANHFDQKGLMVSYLNVGASHSFPFGKVHAVNAIHSSSFADGSYGGLAQGYVFSIEDKRIYLAGDTALTMDMQLIPKYIGKLDLAVLPIGNTFTMGYEEACKASDLLECSRVLGCHFDTFPPIEINHEEAIDYFKKNRKELLLLNIGDFIEI